MRPITDADLPFLLALYCSFRTEEMAAVPWPRAQKDAFLAEQFRLQHLHFVRHFPNADFWVVERRGKPAGRLYLDRSGSVWRVIDIGFAPEARGLGLGKALLEWVQAAAQSAGAEAVALHVMIQNEGAARLYRRLGYINDGPPTATHQPMRWSAS